MAGFFDGLLERTQNPLFLGGMGLLTGGGTQGMMQGMQVGSQFQDRQRKMQQEEARKQALGGALGGLGLKPEEMQFLQADPEVGGAILKSIYAGRFDPMAGLNKRYKEAQISDLEARAKRQPASAAPKYVVVNGRLVRTDSTGVADVTPQSAAKPEKPVYTPAETAVDRNYAKSYEEEIVGGGLADVQKNVGQLEGVYGDLTGGKKNLTGPVVGRIPDIVNSVINPDAVDARENVEEVVQRNLRIILGAQFTNEEGKRLIARAYNPALDEQTNAKRVGNLINAMKQALSAKQAAARYYEQNGTLKGFQGRKDFTMRDFEDAIDSDKLPGRVPGQARQPVAPKTQQEYQSLPSGTSYMAPDGSMRVKP